VRAMVLSVVGAVLAGGVAIHEWLYRQDHKYAPGVSGVLVVLSIAAMLGCIAVADLAWEREQERERQARQAFTSSPVKPPDSANGEEELP